MRTSIATVSISGDLTTKLGAIAAADFDGIEIFEQDFIAHDGSPRDVGRMVRDHGLEIMLFQPFRDFEGLPEPHRAKAFDRAELKFDLMQELGTDLVLICSSVHPQSLGGIDRTADDFNALGERAAKRGLRVGYEALAWGRHIDDHRDAWEVVRRANHPNIGLILDSFHTLGRKLDPETIRRVPGDKIFFVQLADAPAIDMDLLYWSRHFRNMPGEGDLDVVRFMRSVMATGYQGPISLEIFNDQFRGSSADKVARDGHRSLVALMDDVRNAEPTLKIEMPEIPARENVEGVSFLEFASRNGEARNLEMSLQTMGFEQVGSHRNKLINLWQQGEIRIVVNEEVSGHAAKSFDQCGTVICDFGLMVSNAELVVARAKALGAKAFVQPIGPGELDIPAIHGLSDSVLHFLDTASKTSHVWETEFGARNAPEGAGLTHVDHLAQTMSYEDMLSWTLFYTSNFKMGKSPMVDVFDPDGLIRSQVVESDNGALRVTLNGADTQKTFAGSFLADTSGASVQHVALATDDIFKTLCKMQKAGFEPLHMSSNYYDDLAARFDFPAGLLEKMRAANVLYDRDPGGEFFQCYSCKGAGGLFFEIVQRDGGYKGFGGPNAPFRIAAQKRQQNKR